MAIFLISKHTGTLQEHRFHNYLLLLFFIFFLFFYRLGHSFQNTYKLDRSKMKFNTSKKKKCILTRKKTTYKSKRGTKKGSNDWYVRGGCLNHWPMSISNFIVIRLPNKAFFVIWFANYLHKKPFNLFVNIKYIEIEDIETQKFYVRKKVIKK